MSIRLSVLALLSQGPRYGARLKAEFETRTGGIWPLNVGQVYTTLARLERDGLVTADGKPDDEGKIAYHLTDAGRAEVYSWWTTPLDRTDPARDELVIKLALAGADPSVELAAVIHAQRSATMARLQTLTRHKITAQTAGKPPTPAHANGSDPFSERLVVEHQLFLIEAELRWLDHVEALASARHTSAPAGTDHQSTSTAAPTTGEQS